MSSDAAPALTALAAAVRALPEDRVLRRHYAEQLLAHGAPARAIEQAGLLLESDPTDTAAALVIAQAAAELQGMAPALPEAAAGDAVDAIDAGSDYREQPEPTRDTGEDFEQHGIDWNALEEQLDTPFAPPFEAEPTAESAETRPGPTASIMTLDDVGGLDAVKARIRESFLEPMRNPEIARAFGKSLRGGLLLYGPPGCGKTYIARAIAGELRAHFLSVSIADVLGMWVGESESNMHRVFDEARALAPAVLFFDEVDAIGGKRSAAMHSGGMRNVVNQMLMEMDGIGSDNEGLFVLAATNHPWDVDSALVRPGRFDRMVLVLPPDEPAREAILRRNLAGRPVEGISLGKIVGKTDGYSGADLEHICETAAEKAMMASIAQGEVRPITMADLNAALREIKPSVGAWMQSARNVVAYGNSNGQYDELEEYLRVKRLL